MLEMFEELKIPMRNDRVCTLKNKEIADIKCNFSSQSQLYCGYIWEFHDFKKDALKYLDHHVWNLFLYH